MWFKWIHPAPLSEAVTSKDAWIYYCRTMKCIGWVAPKQWRYRLPYFIWIMIVFGLATVDLPIGMTITCALHYNEYTAGGFITFLQTILEAYGLVVKVIIVRSQLWRFNDVREALDKMDKRCHKASEKLKIHTAVAKANQIFLVYLIMYVSFAIFAFLSGLANGRTTWQVYNPFYSTNSLQAVLMEFAVGLSAVLMNLMTDIYAIVFLVIIRAHISILRNRIATLREDKSLSNSEHLEKLIQCIIDHKLILKYCNSLRPVISGTIFVQYLLIGSTLGLTLINIYFFSDVWLGITNIVYGFILVCQTFPFCYLCDLVADDCLKLTYTLFHSNWIDAEKRYKKIFIYFLLKLHQPISFTASGVFHIGLNSNITVAKFAFSVVTIAKQSFSEQ